METATHYPVTTSSFDGLEWSQSQAQDIHSFEYSWDIEINQLGYEIPTSADTTCSIVYIGDSGGGTPGGYGAAGYFSGDNQGYPMIVIAKQTVTDQYYMDFTIAHEFFRLARKNQSL